ncbi:MAG: general secretion pathway protein GspB [Desulfuromonadaceae bacterium]
MSYILEALKKSEKKRKGKQGTLAHMATHESSEHKPEPPRRPVWPLLLGLALVINAGVMLLIFYPGETPPPAPSSESSSPVQTFAEQTPGESVQQNMTDTSFSATTAREETLHSASASAKTRKAEIDASAPAPASAISQSAPPQGQPHESASATAVQAPGSGEKKSVAASIDQSESSASSNNKTQTVEAAVPESPAEPEDMILNQGKGTQSNHPLTRYSDLPSALRSQLPALHMSVHAYSGDPSGGLVRVNNKMLRPGNYLEEGLRLKEITREGAIFNYAGQEFLLPRR